MNILLVIPDIKLHYANGSYVMPSLVRTSSGGCQILAALTPREHSVTIIEEINGEKTDFSDNYDLVGISMMTAQAARGYEIADAFKKLGVPVVIGGFHASLMPEEALLHADAVCVGEGEKVWHTILDDTLHNRLSGIYRAEKLIDMSEVPFQRRELVKKGMKNNILTSRGCPYHCVFCSIIKFFGNTYRVRPVGEVIGEITEMKRKRFLKYNIVLFSDDNIVGDRAYAKELFTALIPLKIRWVSQASINIAADDELLDLAKKSGCTALTIGFESVSKASLIAANKTVRIDYETAIQKIHGKKIAIVGMFIYGFDTDTTDIFEETVDFVEKNCLEYAAFCILTPYPGTPVYAQLEREGRLLHKNWEDYDMIHTVFTPKNMTAEELQRGRYVSAAKINSLRSVVKRVFGARTKILFPLALNFAMRKIYKNIKL
ncbi:MAG: B12-binding domain-containing radical SAM protein [Clostridiales bacterium]|jgi:radical SAM superfamily enzyme YgiQ (UPF0313 family)|nr:B12-binding domain-containing radical SAM protein [Clostridiales bacterium]